MTGPRDRQRNNRILLVSHEMTYTGAPRSLLNTACVLRELGWQVRVWTLRPGAFAREFAEKGFPAEEVSFPEEASEHLAGRIAGYGLVIANTVFCGAFAGYAGRYARTVLWLREAGNLAGLVRDCGLNGGDIEGAEHLVCVSGYAEACIRRDFRVKEITVLPNFVEDWTDREERRERKGRADQKNWADWKDRTQRKDRAERKDRAGRRQGLKGSRRASGNSRPVRFMVSGTVEPRKGQDTALEAFLALPEELQGKAELHFAGAVPEWAEAFWKELRLDSCENVFYRGEVHGREELFRLYQSMDVMVVASRDEACSLAALEAAMLGRALLVTECTGAKYLAAPGCILPAGDAQALSAAMAGYIRSPRRIGEEGAENRRRYLQYGTREIYKRNLDRYLEGLEERTGEACPEPDWKSPGAGLEPEENVPGAGLEPEENAPEAESGPDGNTAEEGRIPAGGPTGAGRARVTCQYPYRVSVVVPVYNAGRYLCACMDSLLGQTLPGMEVICVDDGSTDESPGILEEYVQRARASERGKGSVLRVIRTENRGYGCAVNRGMEAALGEYVGIVEPDDYVDCVMYEKLYHCALAMGAEIVKSDFCRFTGEGEAQRRILCRAAGENADYGRVICPAREKGIFRFPMNTWCGIYHRAFLEKYGIRHNETPGASYQDNGFWFQGFCRARRVVFLRGTLYYNRRDNEQSSVNRRDKVYCAGEEYAFIRRFLAAHRDLEKEFLPQYSMKKYHTYLFTLDRIAWEHKREFLERFSAEFIRAEKEGELDRAVFTPQEWGNLRWIMRSPKDYFRKKVEGEVQISVVLPVYNVEKYLEQCLESLENQQFGQFEVLCIDDGSTDGSAQILKRFAAGDRRFAVHHQANAGAGAARNAGLRMARGEYVIFLDADDYFEPQMLLHAWQKIRETDSDICVMGSRQYDERTGETTPCTYSLQTAHYPAFRPFRVQQMEYNPFRAFMGWAWDKLYRRDFLLNHGLEFQELRTSNDMYFAYMSLFKADRIATLEERVICQRRNREGSLSASRDRSWGCFYEALLAVRRELEGMGLYRENRVYFVNYAVHSCLWNLTTLPRDAACMLLERLLGGWLEELDIASFEEAEAEYPAEYAAYREMVQDGTAGLDRCRNAWRESQARAAEGGRRGGTEAGRRGRAGRGWRGGTERGQKRTGREQKREAERGQNGTGNAVRSPGDFPDEASYYRYCLEEIRRSKSYKIGLAVTWVFRKLRGWSRGILRRKTTAFCQPPGKVFDGDEGF